MGEGTEKTHPLKLWRLTQLMDGPGGNPKTLTKSEASRRFGVPPAVWGAWEKWPHEKGSRIPSEGNMRKLFRFTAGQVRPDHFYNLPMLKAAMRSGEAATAVTS